MLWKLVKVGNMSETSPSHWKPHQRVKSSLTPGPVCANPLSNLTRELCLWADLLVQSTIVNTVFSHQSRRKKSVCLVSAVLFLSRFLMLHLPAEASRPSYEKHRHHVPEGQCVSVFVSAWISDASIVILYAVIWEMTFYLTNPPACKQDDMEETNVLLCNVNDL